MKSLNLEIIHFSDLEIKNDLENVIKIVDLVILNRINELTDKKNKDSTPSAFQAATPQEGNFNSDKLK